MKDDLKKYINLAHNLDELIHKSLMYGNKEKLYESFIRGQLLFEQVNNDLSELDGLNIQYITDTGTSAPYTDVPYTGLTATTLNQRQQSTLPKNDKLRRPWGDPYIYYSATSGDYYFHNCGKDLNALGKPITPCKKITSNEWRKATNTDAINSIKTKVFGVANNVPNETEPKPKPQENNQQSNVDVKKRFRDTFYSTYAWFLAKEYFGTVKTYPTYPAYKTQIDIIFDGFDVPPVTYEFDLVNGIAPEGFELSDKTINNSVNNFITKQITINNVNYKLDKYSNQALYTASSIFKDDSSGYKGQPKIEKIINLKQKGIYKVE